MSKTTKIEGKNTCGITNVSGLVNLSSGDVNVALDLELGGVGRGHLGNVNNVLLVHLNERIAINTASSATRSASSLHEEMCWMAYLSGLAVLGRSG